MKLTVALKPVPTDPTSVSIWTVAGRLRLPFICGERQKFSCRSCSLAGLADHIAAQNLRALGRAAL